MNIRAWKARQGCCDCGERDPDALDCDHDGHPDDKAGNVADLTGAARDAELRKVVVRCVRCHRRVTALRIAMAQQELADLDEIAFEDPSKP